MNCQIRIELLSDMCVSDGGVYNSMLDTEICSTSEGFPYIPAKRLRGCLRECALELQDWGYPISPEKLFGAEGDSPAEVRIGDAMLEGIEKLRQQFQAGHVLFHRQNVLNHYSYIRTQTAVNSETGTAEEASLRTIRVASKGLVFYSQVHVREELMQELEACCAILSSMGIGRTRGLGEVSVSVIKNDQGNCDQADAPLLADDADCLTYEIELQEPLIAKSVRGGQEKTQDYLEGSKIFGYILQALKKDHDEDTALQKLNGIACSNAYIRVNGHRGKEIPACYYMVKDISGSYINKAYETKSNMMQFRDCVLTHVGHCYVNGTESDTLIRETVDTEERYHHRRPDDKSIGRADSGTGENAHFYQISSVCAGQTFCGSIFGSPDQIRTVYETLKLQPEGYMGYARMSEYGRVRIRITNSFIRKSTEYRGAKDIRVTLNAPTIIYNERAMYSTSWEDLLEEICCAMNIRKQAIESVEKYLKYTLIGGYNVTWGARTPVVEGFDKGTTVILHLNEAMDLSVPQGLSVGERTREGYGELDVQILEDPFDVHYTGKIEEEDPIFADASVGDTVDASGGLVESLTEDLFRSYIRTEAIRKARESGTGEEERSTISNMVLMAEENSTIERIRAVVDDRYSKITKDKEKKKQYAYGILKSVETQTESIVEQFSQEYGIRGYSPDRAWLQMEYLREYLIQLKYQIRKNTNRKGDQIV